MNKPVRIPMAASSTPAELANAKQEGYFSIGRAAELSGVTAKMIRHYESLELIPKAARTVGDYRVYTQGDIHVLRFIRRARSLGFSMDEINGLLGLWRNQRRASKQVKRLALNHIAELDSKIAELQSMRAELARDQEFPLRILAIPLWFIRCDANTTEALRGTSHMDEAQALLCYATNKKPVRVTGAGSGEHDQIRIDGRSYRNVIVGGLRQFSRAAGQCEHERLE